TSLSQTTQTNDHERNISNVVLRYEWVNDANAALRAAEQAEANLSYASSCKSESARKLSGSYYTPADVADFFWEIFFSRRGIDSSRASLEMLDECIFIEPSVGAGALFLSLIKKLLLTGLFPRQLARMRAELVDSNEA